MRICFIVGSFPSLSETFILNQVTGLLERGHTVRIYAGSRSSEAIAHEDVQRYGLLSLTRFYHDKPSSRFVRFLKFLFLFPGIFLRAPMPVLRALNVLRFKREAWSLNLFFKTYAFLEVRDYDVALCHFGQNGLVGLLMKDVGALKGILVTAFHAADLEAFIRRAGRDVYRDLFQRGDLFLPVSDHARRKLLELGCPQEKIRVQRMGVEVHAHLPRPKAFGAAGPLKILSVARLVEKKGISFGLEAVALLRRAGVEVDYTIIGDGFLRSALEAQARRSGLETCVRFRGWQEASVVAAGLDAADVLLAPSVRAKNGDEEGIPVVLMEAMVRGVCVVTTATGGIAELVIDQETGFLVPSNDGPALAQVLREVVERAQDMPAVVGRARQAVEARHEISALNRDLEKILLEMVHA